MSWYNTPGKNPETVISTRVRFARNIDGYPFPSRMDEKTAGEIIKKVSVPLTESGFTETDFSKLTQTQALSHVEKHLVSPEFAAKKGAHALFTEKSTGVAVMVCEEDHLRIQCILPGLAVDEAYRNASLTEKRLDEAFDFAYSDDLGYLTNCPTNLGSGMRASVMMFLPALTAGGYMDSLAAHLSNLGLTVRGLWGEGSGSAGCLYQISNQVTLGITEKDTLNKIKNTVRQICESEEKARKEYTGEALERLTDRILRAQGTLLYSYRMSSSEMIRLLADLRLGISLGIVKDVTYGQIGTLLVEGMPATLTLCAKEEPKTVEERDKLRSQKIREILKKK